MITTVVDLFSGEVELLPCNIQDDGKTVGLRFMQQVFPRHGLPSKIVSDRDTRFASDFWETLFMATGTTLAKSIAYHPQSDGGMEAKNKLVAQILRTLVGRLSYHTCSSRSIVHGTNLRDSRLSR
jgi:hypothetical protein